MASPLNAAAATDRRPPLGLFAGSDDFWTRFPRGVEVYDANGYRIMRCVWCNPETGETIRYPISDSSTRYLMGGTNGYRQILNWLRTRFGIYVNGELMRVHSFLPAPIRLIPKPSRREPLPERSVLSDLPFKPCTEYPIEWTPSDE
jgi:hypothetical protein